MILNPNIAQQLAIIVGLVILFGAFVMVIVLFLANKKDKRITESLPSISVGKDKQAQQSFFDSKESFVMPQLSHTQPLAATSEGQPLTRRALRNVRSSTAVSDDIQYPPRELPATQPTPHLSKPASTSFFDDDESDFDFGR